jgi:signal transduction histidine kinase
MSINGYAEGIRDGIFSGPSLDHAIDIIHKESQRLRDIVENMIDITILDQPHETYLLPHDLDYIMDQALETVGGYALERGIQIKCEISPAIGVIGDWDQLHSLFVNVLSNAIRHANHNITVTAALGNHNTQVTIKITDDGAGFTKTDLENAFDYFYTGDKKGSGLGLTIVKKIVEEHAGAIKLCNAPTSGGVVQITLPSSPES